MAREKRYIHAGSAIGAVQEIGTHLEVDLDTGQVFIPKERLKKFKK